VSKQAFDKKIEALEGLRSSSEPAPQLRKAIQDRNNYVVSKAAAIAGSLKLDELIPDLAAAFDRFLSDPVKSDPQCWAKNAIAKALKDLGCREARVFLLGIGHVQPEPVWGGQADSAGTLRGTCALALVDCHLDDLVILTHLTDRLADTEAPVRVDAALALAQFGRPEGILPLRLKAGVGDQEPEVIGQCFASLLALAPSESLGFVGQFLNAKKEEVRGEAAAALAQSREPEAFRILMEFYKKKMPAEVRHSLLMALGASPLPEAADFLLTVIQKEAGDFGVTALKALGASRFRHDLRDRVRVIVEEKDEETLRKVFQSEFA
jgi:HEAT repeat protein